MEKIELLKLAVELMKVQADKRMITMDELKDGIDAIYFKLSSLYNMEGLPGEAQKVQALPFGLKSPLDSIDEDRAVCLECGKKFTLITRNHLQREHGLTVREYKEKWGLPQDLTLASKRYVRRRREIAKAIGLGERRKPAA